MPPKAKVQSDFKHRVQKVGKKKLIAASATNTQFKWTRLVTDSKQQAPQDSDASLLATTREHSLDDILAACRNHNAGSRADGLARLLQLARKDPVVVSLNISRVISTVADRIADPEANVRATLADALPAVLDACPPSALLPFIPLLSTYLTSALSKLQSSLRLDAAVFAYTLARAIPSSRAPLQRALVPCVVSLLDPQLHPLSSMSFAGSIMPSNLALGRRTPPARDPKSAAPPAAASSATGLHSLKRQKLDSTEARIVITVLLNALLCPLPGFDSSVAAEISKSNGTVERSVAAPTECWGLQKRVRVAPRTSPLSAGVVRWALEDLDASWDSAGLSAPGSAPAAEDSLSLLEPSVSASLILLASRHLFQLWLDCSPPDDSKVSPEIQARQALVSDALAAVVKLATSTTCSNGFAHAAQMRNETPELSIAQLFVHSPLPPRVRAAAGSLSSQGTAARILEQCFGEAKRSEDDSALSSMPDGPLQASPLWRGLRALQAALRQHILSRFPFESTRGGVRNELSSLRLNLAIVELFSSLLPSPVVLRGVAKQSSLHSSSWPSDTSVTDPTTRKRHRLADCIPASVSQIDADAESLDDSGSDGFDVDTAFLSHNLIKKGTPRHSSQFREASGVVGALDVISRITAFLVEALDAAATPTAVATYSSKLTADADMHFEQDASTVTLTRLLTLAHSTIEYLEDTDACKLTHRLTALYEAIPQSSFARIHFAVAFAARLRADIQRRAAVNDPTLSSTCGDARLPHEIAAKWLDSFPRVLWAAGAQNPVSASALISTLHDLARLAVQPTSPLALVLRSTARQLAPVIYTVAVKDGGGVWGPFLYFSAALQMRLIAVLQLSQCSTPALRRALCSVARQPRVSCDVRSHAVETLVALSLESNAPSGDSESQISLTTAATLRGAAAVLSLLLGRSTEFVLDVFSQYSEYSDFSRLLSIGQLHEADASRITDSETGDSDHAGWGWQVNHLCERDVDVFHTVLWSAEAAYEAIVAHVRSKNDAAIAHAAIFAAIASILPPDLHRRSAVVLPSAAEACVVLSLFRFCRSLEHIGRLFDPQSACAASCQCVEDAITPPSVLRLGQSAIAKESIQLAVFASLTALLCASTGMMPATGGLGDFFNTACESGCGSRTGRPSVTQTVTAASLSAPLPVTRAITSGSETVTGSAGSSHAGRPSSTTCTAIGGSLPVSASDGDFQGHVFSQPQLQAESQAAFAASDATCSSLSGAAATWPGSDTSRYRLVPSQAASDTGTSSSSCGTIFPLSAASSDFGGTLGLRLPAPLAVATSSCSATGSTATSSSASGSAAATQAQAQPDSEADTTSTSSSLSAAAGGGAGGVSTTRVTGTLPLPVPLAVAPARAALPVPVAVPVELQVEAASASATGSGGTTGSASACASATGTVTGITSASFTVSRSPQVVRHLRATLLDYGSALLFAWLAHVTNLLLHSCSSQLSLASSDSGVYITSSTSGNNTESALCALLAAAQLIDTVGLKWWREQSRESKSVSLSLRALCDAARSFVESVSQERTASRGSREIAARLVVTIVGLGLPSVF